MMFPKLHIELERWKWNEEYELWVSNFGNFKDALKRDVKTKMDGGYIRVINWEKEKSIFAHRLVMITWRPIENAQNMTIDHLDHNKRNNRLKNLEWVPEYENINRARRDEVIRNEKLEEEIRIENKIKTMNDFYFLVNGEYFTDISAATEYVKKTIPYLDALSITEDKIKKIFKTLVNAYNSKVSMYVENGFVKEKHHCKFSIILKGE